MDEVSGWERSLIAVEIKKFLAFRLEVFGRFFGMILGSVVAAYFIWSAVFEARGTDEIGGYSLSLMVLYSLLTPMAIGLSFGGSWADMTFARDIYQGYLSRYLLYPVSVIYYKWLEKLGQNVIFLIQCALTVGIYLAFFDLPQSSGITVFSVMGSLVALFLSSLLGFVLISSLEMCAFWVDNVWSLVAILRMGTWIMGGQLIPLTLFPEDWRRIAELLPFQLLVSFPVRVFLGQADFSELLRTFGVWVFWMSVSSMLMALLWKRGRLKYTGVGV